MAAVASEQAAAVASEQAAAASILTRVDRLDIMLGYLEELRGSRGSAYSTTTSSGGGGAVTTSDGGNSSVSSSPMSIDRRRCRPIGDVVVETQIKGNLIDRVQQLELRLLKMEEGIEFEKGGKERKRNGEKRSHVRGLKRLVASCVKGDLNTKE